jgi:peptide-methionine (R)-S-oxide reductase
MTERVERSPDQWRRLLTAEQYRITREKGTERAFTGAYWNTKTPGTYVCICCGASLFSSRAKFDSGTGWPSFSAPLDADSIATQCDDSVGMVRTEVLCRRCDAHLGHVFDDGPPPTGLRFCLNSASLKLLQAGEEGTRG